MKKLREKAIATDQAERFYARQEAYAQGLAAALAEDVREARVALRMGISCADVAQFTGLDAIIVDELAQEIEAA